MAEPSPYNAANERTVKHRKERERRDSEHEEAAIQFVMGQPQGRHFVWWLLGMTKMFEQAFTGNNQTFFNCGKQDVGLELQARLEEVAPKEFILMWQEHLREREQLEKADDAMRVNSIQGGQNVSDSDIR